MEKANGTPDVEKLPYEGDGAFIVQGDMWKVGTRYELVRSVSARLWARSSDLSGRPFLLQCLNRS